MTDLAWRDEDVRGFGMTVGGPARVLRPTTTEQVAEAFADVRKAGGTIQIDSAPGRGTRVRVTLPRV